MEFLAGNRIRGTSAEKTGMTVIDTITKDGSSQSINTATNGTTLVKSITIGNNNNRILIVSTGVYNAQPTVSGVTLGSQNFVKAISASHSSHSFITELWYLINPDVGTADITVTWSSTAGRRGITGTSFYNVDQSQLLQNNVQNTVDSGGQSSTVSGTITPTTTGSIVIDAMMWLNGTQASLTRTAGAIQFIGGNDRSTGQQYMLTPTIGSANTMNYTASDSARWIWVGVEVKAIETVTPALMPALQSPSVGGWKEIARVTSNDTDVINIPDKRYLMVLSDHGWNTANAGIGMQINGDTSASQYPRRYSANGGTDATPTTETNIFYDTMGGGTQTGKRWFMVQHIANKSDQEKLIQYNMVFNRNGLTASYAPSRITGVAKWVNTSASINRLDLRNFNSGTITSDSEVVVLGWDPTDTHTDNFWEELASVELESGNVRLSSGTITAKKYLWFQYYIKGASSCRQKIQFNGSTASDYAFRYSANGAVDSASDGTAYPDINASYAYANNNKFGNMFVINNASNEKLLTGNSMEITSGTGSAINTMELAGKWTNTSDQITQIDIWADGGSTAYDTGSILKVWGHD